jgi:hypothetical protein
VCFFILHARLRAHRAPGIPCALWAKDKCKTRTHRAAGMQTLVIASDAKQSSFLPFFTQRKLDCFVARAPRNDDLWLFEN